MGEHMDESIWAGTREAKGRQTYTILNLHGWARTDGSMIGPPPFSHPPTRLPVADKLVDNQHIPILKRPIPVTTNSLLRRSDSSKTVDNLAGRETRHTRQAGNRKQ